MRLDDKIVGTLNLYSTEPRHHPYGMACGNATKSLFRVQLFWEARDLFWNACHP
jgi:hypothetical protein